MQRKNIVIGSLVAALVAVVTSGCGQQPGNAQPLTTVQATTPSADPSRPSKKPSETDDPGLHDTGLGLHLKPGWHMAANDAAETSWTVTDTENCINGSSCPTAVVLGPDALSGSTVPEMGDLPQCAGDEEDSTYGPVVQKGTRQIGDKTATYYEAELCASGTPQTMRFWEISDPHVIVYTMETSGTKMIGLEDVLKTASWK